MTPTEIIALSKITGEPIPAVEGKVSGISAELETELRAKIVAWNANEEKVKVEIHGEVRMRAKWLLADIRKYVRVLLGWNELTDSERTAFAGSVVVNTSVGW